MEAAFEQMITNRLPLVTPETAKQITSYVKQFFKKEVINKGKVLHPGHHSDKLTNFTKFADFIGKADDTTTSDQIIEATRTYCDQYWDSCTDNPLEYIANNVDDPPKMIAEAQEEIAKASKKMLQENFRIQGIVIIAQYALLWYLWAQSKRVDKVIEGALRKLNEIKQECIDPALKIIYVDAPTQTEEKNDAKRKVFNENMNTLQRRLAEVYLNQAARRIEDSIEALEDKKQASFIHGVVGVFAFVGSAYFTAGLGSGFASLFGSTATRGTALCVQQGVFTAASGLATAGHGAIAIKHGMNFQRCQECLDSMNELKKTVDYEKEVLEKLQIVVINRER